MQFGAAIKAFWTKYATFSGRARRSEFWYAQLFLALVAMGVAIVFPGEDGNNSAASNLWSLATLVPSLAIGARRLHDTGRSAKNLWWLLLVIVGWIILLVYLIEDSKPGANEYGAAVKTEFKKISSSEAAAGTTVTRAAFFVREDDAQDSSAD